MWNGDADWWWRYVWCQNCLCHVRTQQRPREIASQSYKYKRDSYCHTWERETIVSKNALSFVPSFSLRLTDLRLSSIHKGLYILLLDLFIWMRPNPGFGKWPDTISPLSFSSKFTTRSLDWVDSVLFLSARGLQCVYCQARTSSSAAPPRPGSC